MVRPRYVIEGDKKVARELQKMLDGVPDLREGAGAEAAGLIAERAEAQAPVRSGALRDTIRTFATKTNAGVRVGFARTPWAGPIIGGFGGPGAPRAQGGYNAPPRPFPFDAADQRVTDIVRVYEDFIDDLIDGRPVSSGRKYKRHESS